MKKIIELIKKDVKKINLEINKRLESSIILINKVIQYIINNKGKQIRPLISILIAKALCSEKKQHIIIAALIECIHTATLLHDDVIDDSHTRRGKTAANIIFGNSTSILVGDFIYTRAFQMMTELKSIKILSLMANAVNMIAEGEILQLTHCHNPTISIRNYMDIIYKKTACLFEVASQSSAILASANSNQEKALRNYGRHIGIAFQLINDVSDYDIKNITSKNYDIGNDLNTGKTTLPLLHAMKHSTPKQNLLIQQAIKTGNNRHLLNIVLNIMYTHGSLEYTKEYAKKEIKQAILELNILPYSLYRQALEKMANLIIKKYS